MDWKEGSNWTGFNGIDAINGLTLVGQEALNGLVVVGWEVLVPFPSEYALTNDAVGMCQLSSNTSNVTELVHRRPSDCETFCFRFS